MNQWTFSDFQNRANGQDCVRFDLFVVHKGPVVGTKIWTLAGFVCDIPHVGDYFRYDLGAESFLIVRSETDRIQAFYNVCPHRGNQIVTSDFGTVRDVFTCAFHGWSFGINGDLQSISDEETYRPEVIAHRPGQIGRPTVRTQVT